VCGTQEEFQGFVVKSKGERPLLSTALTSYATNETGGGYLEDLGVDGRVKLKWIVKKLDMGMEWIDLALGREKWRAPVGPVTDLRVS
jgi:hypothetical protein